jgi:UDP-N-acetylmuramate dehydrogenase
MAGGLSAFVAAMTAAFGDRVQANEPLAPLTTFKVGGPADWLFESRSSGEVGTALRIAHGHDVAVTMLGGGSNVLIADEGVRGLVIRPRGGDILQLDERHVRADAAVTINGLVRWTVMHGCAGLEAWAGTPGTVGGAIFGNAHFGGRLIGDLIERVRVASRIGDVADAARDDMAFGYDQSRLQGTGEILLSADFSVADDTIRLENAIFNTIAGIGTLTAAQFRANASGRLYFPEPPPGGTRARGCSVVGRRARRSRRSGAAVGGASVSPAHGNFIVNAAPRRRAIFER